MYVNVVNHVASRASDDVKLVMYFPAEALHNAAYYKVQQGERRHISCLDEGSSGCDRPMTTALSLCGCEAAAVML